MKKSTLCFLGSFIGIPVLVKIAEHQTSTGEYMGDSAAIVMFVAFIVLPVFGFIFRWYEKRKKYQALSIEEREKFDADEEQKREEAHERAQERRDAMIADRTIVSTAIVNSTTIGKQRSSVASSVARASVGGLVSPGWALVGALTPKKITTTKTKDVTFSIRYASGRCTTEKVKFGSHRYKELIKYIA